tara:strand:- start:1182 stop:1745 length:564 start_codon:yes stop_codon:yes gene_type:complete
VVTILIREIITILINQRINLRADLTHSIHHTHYKTLLHMDYKLLTRFTGADLGHSNEVIADFLHEHLGKYGDSKIDILMAIDYVFDPHKPGGNIILLIKENLIIGAVVINETGMSKYIPENILVYIAVHADHRGKGIGKELMKNAIKLTKGDMALHVESDNPAVFLYEKMGFENKYLEMRYKRKNLR